MAMTSASGSRIFREQGIRDAELLEPLGAQQARVAPPARRAILSGVVAAAGERVVDAELDAAAQDAGLGELDERGVDLQPRSLDAGPGRELRHLLVGREVLRPAVRVAAVVERVHADEEIVRLQRFRPGEREAEEDRVARRDVGRRNRLRLRREQPRAVLRHLHVGSERRAAELAKVEFHDLVPRDAHGPGDALRALELVDVALAVAEAERAELVAFVPGDREHGRRIQAAAQEDHRLNQESSPGGPSGASGGAWTGFFFPASRAWGAWASGASAPPRRPRRGRAGARAPRRGSSRGSGAAGP